MNSKPIIMITFTEGGENGGPFNSHKRIMESSLREQYNFIPLVIPKGRIGLFNIKLIKKLSRDIIEANPDIVHFTGLQLQGFHVVLACRLAKVKNTIMAIRGSSMEAVYFPRWKKWIVNIMEIATLKLSKLSYGVSEYVANWDRVKYSSNFIGHIYNLPEFNENEKGESIRKELGISNEDIIVVSTGRITKEKGYSVLLDSIKRVKFSSKVKFLIVGDGEYLNEMKREIKKNNLEKNVFFTGYRNDVESILSECDIFVTCTLHETLGNSLLEAAKHSLPLIATDVGGIPEIVKNGENGFLVQINDCDTVKNSLEILFSDKYLRLKMGKKAKELVNQKFDSQKILDQLDKAYRSLLS